MKKFLVMTTAIALTLPGMAMAESNITEGGDLPRQAGLMDESDTYQRNAPMQGMENRADVQRPMQRQTTMQERTVTQDRMAMQSQQAAQQKPMTTQQINQKMSANTIREIQQTLREEGFNPGPADGVWGPRTASALEEYQMENNLQPTGQPHPVTLSRLGVEADAKAQGKMSKQASVDLQKNTIREIQQSLRNEGFNPGPADGIWGPRTASALEDFQQENNLQPTGQPHPETLNELGVQAEVGMQTRANQQASMEQSQTTQRTAMQLQQNTIREIQQSLRQEGFDPGPADGVWGPQTASAVRSFQMEKNLQATGEPTSSTLNELGVEAEAEADDWSDLNPQGQMDTESQNNMGTTY